MVGLYAGPGASAAPAAGAPGSGAGNPPPPPGSPPPKPPRPMPPSPKDPDNMLYYRGSRTAQEDLPLTINQVKARRVGADSVDIELVFSQSINPRTVKHCNITIDGLELSQTVRFCFNKKGDTLKFTLTSENDSFKLGIKRVRAFNGTIMSPAELSVEVQAAEEDSACEKE